MKEERGKLMELMDERVEGWPGMEENEKVAALIYGGSSNGQSVRSSRESNEEIMAEEVYS